MKELKRILVSGGGTGGHIMPAVALCEEIRDAYPEAKIYFAGRKRSMEHEIAGKHGLDFYSVPSAPKGRGLKMIGNFFINIAGFCKSFLLLLFLRPDAVAVFGGYTSGALLCASLLLRKNAVIHESNAIPGRVTRTMAKLGVRVACGLPSEHPLMRSLKASLKKEGSFAITGNPLRKAFRLPPEDISKELPGYSESEPLLLIFGGSQGAHKINLLCAETLPKLKSRFPRLQVVHICGGNDQVLLQNVYAVSGLRFWLFPFFEKMASLMRASTLCVARSGALSVTEICASGLPALLIPLPTAADDHQLANARVLEEAGAARICQEADLSAEKLTEELAKLLENHLLLKAMSEAGKDLAKDNASKELLNFIIAPWQA
ncbi:UDP-N-acetylglucosamine--N-acetylmuramyl-(pentapeptide) pyrophosphoryl-undecaprenol N-acetylglucosamine transferase [bacterium]|nr:UDP-N-acetylglucosamine--N-acetylmuramyl-(pentapeptide) pyrophosphoryl-undecaprenol N-acetylglucosamine transferase [bacterium]